MRAINFNLSRAEPCAISGFGRFIKYYMFKNEWNTIISLHRWHNTKGILQQYSWCVICKPRASKRLSAVDSDRSPTENGWRLRPQSGRSACTSLFLEHGMCVRESENDICTRSVCLRVYFHEIHQLRIQVYVKKKKKIRSMCIYFALLGHEIQLNIFKQI